MSTAKKDEGATLDEATGVEISREEQMEILDRINGIAEKNRSTDLSKGFKAKKNGSLFPILANAFAAVMLAGGFFALYAMQGDVEIRAREGERVFNPAERALIEEIRRETVASLAERDLEISAILSSLADVETQLGDLSHDGLTAEQLAARERLGAQRDERRAALALARGERSRVLDEARADEADLQARRDTRARDRIARTAEEGTEPRNRRDRERERADDAVAREEPRPGRRRAAEEERREAEEAELLALREERRAARAARGDPERERGRGRGDAGDELAEARREQRRADAEESQLAGLATRAGRRVAGAETPGEAEEAIESLREALETPAFRGRDGRPRRDMAQVAETLEAVVRDERRGGEARQRMAAIEEQIGALQEAIGMGSVPYEDPLDRMQFITSLLDDSEIRRAVQARLQAGQNPATD
ncbi:MAG: hypothetical protein FWB79_00285 [Treponema sp.]|nr:hypothetical protein [Treponema sp.]